MNWLDFGVVLLITLTLIVAGCGSDSPTEPAIPADVDAYLESLPEWSEFSPPLPAKDEPVADPVDFEEEVNGTNYICQSTRYSMTQTPEKIATLNPDMEVLWVGSLLQGSGYIGGIGTLAELPIRQRAPLTLSIDLLTGDNTRTVEHPDLASVTQAVGELIQAAQDAGHRAGSKIFYNEVTYHSLQESALKLGFSAAYSGVDVKSSLEARSSVETSTVMVTYTQQMFTVSQVLPQTPGEMFSDGFTEARMKEQINAGRLGADNLPVYVSSIVYGRMLVFTMTAVASASEIRGALEIAAGEVGGELSGRQKQLLESAEIGIIAIGGDATNAEQVIRSGDFKSYFEEDSALTTARPISYTIRNLADNAIATVSETTEYDVQECAAEQTGATYRIKILDVTYADRGTLCVIPLCQILAKSKFSIQDGSDSQVVIDELTQDLMCKGDTHSYAASIDRNVSLHFDGRDEVNIFGDVWTDYPSHFKWPLGSIKLKGRISEGVHAKSVWSALNCHKFKLRYRVTKTGVLTD